jgi:ABC-type branched-subunit amino acid transport system ATPase component/ABC-type branched-subunit amino acid transport system permease subunit
MLALLAPTQAIVDGAVNGLVYALIGMGVVLVYRSTKVINLAAGAMGLPGAGLLVVLTVNYGVPYWPALVLALLAGALFAAAVELIVIRRLFDAPRVVLLVATIGVAQLAQAIVLAYPDITDVRTRYPSPINADVHIADVVLSPATLLTLLTVPVAAGALAWLLARTRFGHAVAAASDNARLARLSGISPRRTSTIVWTIAGLLGTITVILIATDNGNVTQVATLGPATMARALAVAVVAGLVSFPRALVAGVAIGVAEAVITFNSIGQPGLADLALFATVLIAVALQSRRDGADGAERFSFMPRVRPVPVNIRDRWWVRHLGALVGVTAVAVAVALPLVLPAPSTSFNLTRILCYGFVALSVSVVTGWAGQLSLGQMALGGVAALVAALFARGQAVTLNLPGLEDVVVQLGPTGFLAAVLIGTLAAAVVAVILGWGALRAPGLLLAVSTFAFAQVCERYLFRTTLLTGGRQPPIRIVRDTVGGVDLGVQRTYYWCCLALIVLVTVAVARVRRRGPGRAIVAVRDNPTTAAAYTVSPAHRKLSGFALSGLIAGLGGALLGGLTQNINTNELFVVGDSLSVVSMAVIGGLGSIIGPFLGALWVRGLPDLFPGNALVPLLSSSIGLLVLLLYLPSGLVQLGYGLRDAAFGWVSRRTPEVAPDARPTSTAATAAARPPSAAAVSSDRAGASLTVRDLSVRFGGNVAVDHVDLDVREGEIVGLIGTNGAGKTTVLNAIGGFVPATGQVHLGDVDLTRMRPEHRARHGLGRTFQSAQLFPSLTVHETVMVGLESRRRSYLLPTALALPPAVRAERRNRADADGIVDLLGLGPYADHTIEELSTGTRRIVELAGLFALDARLLCLDEPTAGVAQRETEAFAPLITTIRQELDATVILIEHDMPLITSISDRIYCLEAGRVIAEGTPDTVRDDPRVIASYLGDDQRAVDRSDVMPTGGSRP